MRDQGSDSRTKERANGSRAILSLDTALSFRLSSESVLRAGLGCQLDAVPAGHHFVTDPRLLGSKLSRRSIDSIF
jgi:hypothetical protein